MQNQLALLRAQEGQAVAQAQQSKIGTQSAMLDLVSKHSDTLGQLVQNNSTQPVDPNNPVATAVAAQRVVNTQTAYNLQQQGIDPNEATPEQWEDAEDSTFEALEASNYFGEAGNFEGGLLGTIGVVGGSALDSLNKERIAKGKKPILKWLQPGEMKMPQTDFGAAASGAVNAIQEDKEKTFLKQNFIWIILAILALIYIGSKISK